MSFAFGFLSGARDDSGKDLGIPTGLLGSERTGTEGTLFRSREQFRSA